MDTFGPREKERGAPSPLLSVVVTPFSFLFSTLPALTEFGSSLLGVAVRNGAAGRDKASPHGHADLESRALN